MDVTPGRWGVPAEPHETLPSCSMVLTSGGLLVAKITSLDGMLYGMVTYVTDDGAPRYWGTWTHFLGQTWQRTLNLPSPLYEPLITARQPSALVQRLGRIARIDPATIVATMSAQDPVLLAEYAKVLDLLAAWCGVDQGAFGIYGSAMYKAAGTNRDVDVVVYGKTACRRTHARINGQLPPRGISHPHHLQFQIPGGAVILDPRFIAPHTITRMLITGDYTDEGTEPIDGLWVIDAADGIFYPSRYTLRDDSVLLSYRVGHSAWLHPGDVLSGPPLPVYQRDGIRYRMLLGCATLTPHRREAK